MQIIIVVLILLAVFFGVFRPGHTLNHRIERIAGPDTFSILQWEVGSLWQEAVGLFDEKPEADRETVIEYFALSRDIRMLKAETVAVESRGEDSFRLRNETDSLEARRAALKEKTELILGGQIRDVLSEQGIHNPLTDGGPNFPPLSFALEELPDVLIVSPRDRIDSIEEIVLRQGLTTEEKEEIEARVDALDVSSLVEDIGGIATYPSLVDNGAGLRFTIETIAEEWTHQYLAFTPLGFRYVLDLSGVSRNYDIASMNESLAGMVSQEVGALVIGKYYPELISPPANAPGGESVFTLEMRETRRTVDELLARGEIEQAEEYMEQRRQRLESLGYDIRKLNQAYFAFHGAYADTPAFISPIGRDLQELRGRSASLKEFLDTASALTDSDELAAAAR